MKMILTHRNDLILVHKFGDFHCVMYLHVINKIPRR